jgi:hypothetical protein
MLKIKILITGGAERTDRIEIFDIKGVQLESSQLHDGVYFLHVESVLGNKWWYKIIKE